MPILVGGTGLYIKAALYDYSFEEENESFDFSDKTNEELYLELKNVDSSTQIHPNNRKRVERALSYYYQHGVPISEQPKSTNLLYDAIFLGLTTDREVLYERINMRVHKMLEDGLLEETKKIYELGYRSKAIMTPICYKELFFYLDGEISFEESIELIQQRSRKYAKRQYTWFHHQLPVEWLEVDFTNFGNTINMAVDKIK